MPHHICNDHCGVWRREALEGGEEREMGHEGDFDVNAMRLRTLHTLALFARQQHGPEGGPNVEHFVRILGLHPQMRVAGSSDSDEPDEAAQDDEGEDSDEPVDGPP